MTDFDLYSEISSLDIDCGGAILTFSARLARENSWTLPYAKRVTAEYLKFVYLAAISPSQVTPSVAVDQAWHLHLCYTRSYWIDLCDNILNRPLHHGPTKGGKQKDSRFKNQYEYTLDRYTKEFGYDVPREIWPETKLRFSQDAIPIWVSRDRYLIIEKATLRNSIVSSGLIATGLVGGCTVASAGSSSDNRCS